MSRNNLLGAISAFESACDKLKEALNLIDKQGADSDYHSLLEDAVIKRFETTFEYWWRMVKAAASLQGSEAPGPRPAIQEAIRFGWIDDPEFWAEALDARNGSVHDYFGIGRDDYFRIVRKFVKSSSRSRDKIRDILTY